MDGVSQQPSQIDHVMADTSGRTYVGMPRALAGAGAAQRDLVQQRDIVAHHRRLANHHARRVILQGRGGITCQTALDSLYIFDIRFSSTASTGNMRSTRQAICAAPERADTCGTHTIRGFFLPPVRLKGSTVYEPASARAP